jgi:hypothetical protein
MQQLEVTFGTPSLDVPFLEGAVVGDFVTDSIIMCAEANASFKSSLAAIKELGDLQKLVENFELSRKPQEALRTLQAGLQEIGLPIKVSETESRFNEQQERRRETLQEALDHHVLYSSLPEGSGPTAHIEDILWHASTIAYTKGLALVEAQEQQMQASANNTLLAVGSSVNLKQHFKDADFFATLAKQLRIVWERDITEQEIL